MKLNRFWVLGIGCYVLFMLASVPARWLIPLLPLPAGISVQGVQGVWYQGSIASVTANGITLEQLHWDWQPSALLQGKLGVALEVGGARQLNAPYAKTLLLLGVNQWQLNDSTLRIPLAWLMPKLVLPMPVNASGQLQTQLAEFRSGTPVCDTLEGTSRWSNAKFQAPSGWLDLQQLEGRWQCQQGKAQLAIAANNPLGAALNLTLDLQGYQLEGTLQPDNSMPKDVHDAMRFVGPQDSQGRFQLQLNSRW